MSGSYLSSIPNKPNSPYALLKLTSVSSSNCENTCLSQDCLVYLITESRTKIGRNSASFNVDVHLTDSLAISPLHLEIWRIQKECIPSSNSFLVQIIGKNGVYMNSTFIPASQNLIQLAPRVTFQFPDTDCQLEFFSNVELVVDKSDILAEAECQQVEQREIEILSQQFAADYIENNKQEESQLDVLTETIFDDDLFPVSSESVLEQNFTDSFLYNPRLGDIVNSTTRLPLGPVNTFQVIDLPNEPSETIARKDVLNDTNTNCSPASKIPTKRPKKASGNNNKKKAKTEPELNEEQGTSERPPFTYSNLIMQAIYNSPNQQLTTSQIYEWIKWNYPFFRSAGKSWKSAVRCNLSSKNEFVKVSPDGSEGGHSCYWRIAPHVKVTILKTLSSI